MNIEARAEASLAPVPLIDGAAFLQLREQLRVTESQRDDWMRQCDQLKREVRRLHKMFGTWTPANKYSETLAE